MSDSMIYEWVDFDEKLLHKMIHKIARELLSGYLVREFICKEVR